MRNLCGELGCPHELHEGKSRRVVRPIRLRALFASIHVLDLVRRYHSLRQMHGSFHSLHMQHNINSLLVYWLTGHFSQGPVLCYQFFCYRTWLASSDDASINLYNRDQLSACAGEKALVSIE